MHELRRSRGEQARAGDAVAGVAASRRSHDAAARNQNRAARGRLEALLAPDHPARTVRAFNWIWRRCAHQVGGWPRWAPAIDPTILAAFWLWATIEPRPGSRSAASAMTPTAGSAAALACAGGLRTEHAWRTRSSPSTSLLDRRLVPQTGTDFACALPDQPSRPRTNRSSRPGQVRAPSANWPKTHRLRTAQAVAAVDTREGEQRLAAAALARWTSSEARPPGPSSALA